MISVIIPVYNAEKTLRRCVDSVLGQSCSDLEVIIVDDGSTDGSGAIADEYALADARVKAVHQENRGLSCARNRGLEQASGAYIAFADADDWLEKETYKTALSALAAHPETDLCVFGHFTDMPGKSIVSRPAEEETVLGPEEALTALIAARTLGYAVWNKLYRAPLFGGIRFPEGYNYEDITVTLRLVMKARGAALLPVPFYHYLQNAGSIVHTPSLKNKLDQWTARHTQHALVTGRCPGRCPAWDEACLRQCVLSAVSVWIVLRNASPPELERERERIDEVLAFVRAHRADILRLRRIPVPIKGAALLVAAGGRRAALPLSAAARLILFLKPVSVFR